MKKALILSAGSRREFDYQEKVLRKIVAETRGDYLPLLEDNNIQGGLMWRFIRVSAGVRQYFRFTGSSTVQSLQANWDCTPGVRGEVNKKVSQEGIRKGLLFDDLGDGGICAPVDYGHMIVLGTGADG